MILRQEKTPDGIEVFTLAQRPELEPLVRSLGDTFPEFMHHDAMVNRYWERLYREFAGFQIAICERGEVVAAGNSVPVFWDGSVERITSGLDGVLERGFQDVENGRAPTVVSALLAIVPRANRGRGLSSVILNAMKAIAAERGLGALIAPVRPTLKSEYPLTPMERYAQWEREDGLPFDPWLRVHRRLGAEFLGVAYRSMLITGTVEKWKEWTGMQFSESGAYVVPGALQPVVMDLEEDQGVYEEPNVWMQHPVSG